MKRCALPIILSIGLSLLGVGAAAQVDTLPGLILTDLHLISQESLPHWTPAWTGPIQGATLCTWFAEHGYPALLHDLNGDGEIDELDTIELADDFGLGVMRTETPRGTSDPRLVVGLAQYIGGFYPDEFVLKIYDPSFPMEYESQGYGMFAPDAIPGILLEIRPEPTIAAYMEELATGEGIIVGLEEEDVDRNRYLSGRSFLYEQTEEGYTPLDFAWAAEDRWEEGHQGQVLETVGRMDDRFYLEFQGNWVPVEFMLALSPQVEHTVETEEHRCPDDAIAYDVTVTTLSGGDIEIEECVIREGDLDIYIWTLTNISYEKNGCGLCFFSIPNPGLPAVLHNEHVPWTFSSGWGSWIWWLPMGSCGLQIGQSSVFMVAVPGPTVDQWVIGYVGDCSVPGPEEPTLYRARTTAPGIPDDDIPGGRCPDLFLRVLDESCVYNRVDEVYDFTVWAQVHNVGTNSVTSSFDVLLTGTSHGGSDLVTVGVPPNLGPGDSVPVTLGFSIPSEPTGGAPCPMTYELMVDSGYDVAECDEGNNLVYGEICCIGEPDQGEDCPDLTIEIDEIECILNRKDGVYELTVTATLSNIGSVAVTDPIWTRLETDRGDDTEVIHTDLYPTDSIDVEYEITFSVNEPGCPLDVTVEADYVDFIDECDEGNNTAEGEACCD